MRLSLPPPPSADSLMLAGAVAAMIDFVLAALILLIGVNAWAPPQDLPWTPLRLADPPGLATRMKFERAADDPALCRRVLSEGGVRFAEAPVRKQGFCSTADAVQLSGGVTPLSPAAPPMRCGEALAYAFWDRHAVQPLALRLLSAPVSRVEHYGTYACRNMYGRAEGRPSEHARANALDVAGFRLKDGRQITVARHFRQDDERGLFLRAARRGACGWFRTVLSPDYNAAHADHLHLDRGPWRACR